MKFANPKLIAIGVGLIVVILVIVAVVASTGGGKSGTSASPSPSSIGITYSNTADLIKNGLTVQQLDDLKFALYNYHKTFNYHVTTISFEGVSVIHDKFSSDATDIMAFTVRFNDKTAYLAKLNFSSLRRVQLTLIDPNTNQPIYDSGPTHIDTPAS